MKIYISGKISNNPNYRKEFEEKFKELESKGFCVLSPLFIDQELDYDDYMHIDYAMLDICQAVYFLKNWSDSNGAKLEHEYAKKHGKTLIFEENC